MLSVAEPGLERAVGSRSHVSSYLLGCMVMGMVLQHWGPQHFKQLFILSVPLPQPHSAAGEFGVRGSQLLPPPLALQREEPGPCHLPLPGELDRAPGRAAQQAGTSSSKPGALAGRGCHPPPGRLFSLGTGLRALPDSSAAPLSTLCSRS